MMPFPAALLLNNRPETFIGLSWALPCTAPSDAVSCFCSGGTSDGYVLEGDPGTVYNATFRIRGVVELLGYTGGTLYDAPYVQKDATGFQTTVNRYSLVISDPAATYYLNKGTFVTDLSAIDYEVTIPIRGGATVTLVSNSVGGAEINNSGNHSATDDDVDFPIVVTQPYNGQFLQLDVIGVS